MRAGGEADRVRVRGRPRFRNTILYQYYNTLYLNCNVMSVKWRRYTSRSARPSIDRPLYGNIISYYIILYYIITFVVVQDL